MQRWTEFKGFLARVTRRGQAGLRSTDGAAHWSCRKLAAALGISEDLVHRIWTEAGVSPHRLERYKASTDPDFESEAADIIGLYLQPPQHAAIF
jgi:hypothetical protein